MNCVSNTISEELYFNMPWTFKETFNEDSSVTESGLSLADCAFKRGFKVRLFAHNAHATSTATHGGLDYNWKAIFLNESLPILIAFDRTWCTWDDGDANFHG